MSGSRFVISYFQPPHFIHFGQLSNRESLRDLIVALEAHRAKQYHLFHGQSSEVRKEESKHIIDGQNPPKRSI